MNLTILKEYMKKNTLLYFGKKQINVLDIYEEFNLVDVQTVCGLRFMVDVSTLTEKPFYEKSIYLEHLITRGEFDV